MNQNTDLGKMEVKGKMIRLGRIILVLGVLMVVIIFLAAGLYSSGLVDSKDKVLKEYYARREDLMGEQQKLEAMLSDLNRTISLEIEKEQNLSDMVLKLTSEKLNLESEQANNTGIIVPKNDTNQTKVPRVVVIRPPPKRTRVTRAS